MHRAQVISLALLLLCGMWLTDWNDAPAALAAVASDSMAGPTSEGGPPVGLDLLPPIPLTRASLDLPSVRQELEAALDAASQRQIDLSEDIAVTENGQTALHLDVSMARVEGEKWIEVNLGQQKLYAWVGDQLVDEFMISSGIGAYPTIEGVFRMWVRTSVQTMSGGDQASGSYYNLPNVQWVQYFFAEYALHGTYWHSNFGTPMSHGCVNLSIEDAQWLFSWTFPEWDGSIDWVRATNDNATLVWVHQ